MIKLLGAELKRSWIQFIRYPLEAIGTIIATTIVFYGLFLSVQYVAGSTPLLGERFDSIVVGYILWTLEIFIVNDIAIGLQEEAQTGTLEQVFLAPFDASKIFLARAFANLTLRLTLISVILFLILILTSTQLLFPPALVAPLLTLLLAALGLAFSLGALALLFKRIQQLLGLFQFCLLFLMTTPVETMTGPLAWSLNLLPMVTSAGILRDLMVRGGGLNVETYSLALANGAVYFCLGLGVFRWAECQAKHKGMLSGY